MSGLVPAGKLRLGRLRHGRFGLMKLEVVNSVLTQRHGVLGFQRHGSSVASIRGAGLCNGSNPASASDSRLVPVDPVVAIGRHRRPARRRGSPGEPATTGPPEKAGMIQQPWFALPTRLLTDPDWLDLDDHDRLTLLALWAHASEHETDGEIRHSTLTHLQVSDTLQRSKFLADGRLLWFLDVNASAAERRARRDRAVRSASTRWNAPSNAPSNACSMHRRERDREENRETEEEEFPVANAPGDQKTGLCPPGKQPKTSAKAETARPGTRTPPPVPNHFQDLALVSEPPGASLTTPGRLGQRPLLPDMTDQQLAKLSGPQVAWEIFRCLYAIAHSGDVPTETQATFVNFTRLFKQVGLPRMLGAMKCYFDDPPFVCQGGRRDSGRFIRYFDQLGIDAVLETSREAIQARILAGVNGQDQRARLFQKLSAITGNGHANGRGP